MSCITLTDDNFDQSVLKTNQPCLVDFWAPWCGPCRAITPIVEEVAKEYAGRLIVGKLNVDDFPTKASEYGFQSIPTLILFHDGKPLGRLTGPVPKEKIVALFEGIL